MIRTYRLLQTWPLWYVGAAIVGLIVCASGLMTGRPSWTRFGAWFRVPLILFLGWLVLVLTISAVVNVVLRLWTMMTR
jgi:hypothetical protein